MEFYSGGRHFSSEVGLQTTTGLLISKHRRRKFFCSIQQLQLHLQLEWFLNMSAPYTTDLGHRKAVAEKGHQL